MKLEHQDSLLFEPMWSLDVSIMKFHSSINGSSDGQQKNGVIDTRFTP